MSRVMLTTTRSPLGTLALQGGGLSSCGPRLPTGEERSRRGGRAGEERSRATPARRAAVAVGANNGAQHQPLRGHRAGRRAFRRYGRAAVPAAAAGRRDGAWRRTYRLRRLRLAVPGVPGL